MQAASLHIDKNQTPKSLLFDDIYFSSDDPLGETRHVFITGNDLKARFAQNKHLVIGELGFGAGVNFLCTLQAKHSSGENAHLDYFAIEKYPIQTFQLNNILSRFESLLPYKNVLINAYISLYRGFNLIDLPSYNARLHLYIGDVIEGLEAFSTPVDAWFLDGFSPAKNPQMWSENVIALMAKRSSQNATFSTFSASSKVKKALLLAGFSVTKRQGFGKKREMLQGHNPQAPCPSPIKPWYRLPKINHQSSHDIAIIGAGMAGVSMAYTLAKKGISSTLYDSQHAIGSKTSSLAFGVLMPFLSADANLSDQYYSQGFVHTYKTMQSLLANDSKHFATVCGLLQLADATHKSARFQKIAKRGLASNIVSQVTKSQAADLSGIALQCGGLYYPLASMINLNAYCHALYDQSIKQAEFIGNTPISRIEQHRERWVLLDQNDQVINSAHTLVICNAEAASAFEPLNYLQFQKIPGQISEFLASEQSINLRCMISTDRVLSPSNEGKHFVGATYRQSCSQKSSTRDHRQNQAAFCDILELGQALAAHVQTRALTKDHLPFVGPMANKLVFMRDYARAKHGDTRFHYQDARYTPNLYVSAGHGSRGLSSTLLAAQIITSMITGVALPISHQILAKLHPSRVLLNHLITTC